MTKHTTLKEEIEHNKRLNKLTPKAKTEFILTLQKEAESRLQINEDLRRLNQRNQDTHKGMQITIDELENDIKTIQARHVAEERMSSSMKSAFIAMQAKYIQLLESTIS